MWHWLKINRVCDDKKVAKDCKERRISARRQAMKEWGYVRGEGMYKKVTASPRSWKMSAILTLLARVFESPKQLHTPE